MSLTRSIGCSLVLLFGFMSFAQGFETAEDVEGAKDSEFFERYPRSKIDDYSEGDTDDYLIALGAPKTVNGVMVLENSSRLSGYLTRLTYRAPDGDSSELLFEHFRQQLASQPHRLLYECHARQCGSSNNWANRILGISKLYGPRSYQHYLAAELETDKGQLLVVLYAIQRGNKRVYSQLDILEPDKLMTKLSVNPDTILTALEEDGVFNLLNLEFDDQDRLADSALEGLSSVVSAMQINRRLRLYVVGHLTGEGAISQLQQRSQTRAESVVSALVNAGIEASRLSAQGIGPLAPISQNTEQTSRIGLVLQ